MILFIVLFVICTVIAMIQSERIAKRDERLGLYNGPHQRVFSDPEAGPWAYGEGATVVRFGGDPYDYFTVLYLRRPLRSMFTGTMVTVQNQRTGQIVTAPRPNWIRV
jgi:hypothetical protein